METAVYIAHAIVTLTLIGALAITPKCSLGYRPLLTAYTFVLMTMVLYISISGAFLIYYYDMVSEWAPAYSTPETILWTFVVAWVGIVLFVGFYHYFSGAPLRLPLKGNTAPRSRANFVAIAYVLVAVGLILKVLYVQRMGGLHDVFLSRSPGIASNLGLESAVDRGANYFSEFSAMADAAACWLFLTALLARKSVALHTLILFVVLTSTFIISPKRQDLLLVILAVMVGFSIYVRPLKLKDAPVLILAGLVFSAVSLAGRILVPAYLAHVNVFNAAQSDAGWKFMVYSVSIDLNLFDGMVVAVAGKEDIIAKFGGWRDSFYRPNFEPLTYAVTRILWPGKPGNLVDVATALRAVEIGTSLEKTIGGTGLGLIGTTWMWGKLFGLVIGMGIFGWAVSFVDRFVRKMHYASPGRIMIFAVCVTATFHFFRQGSLGWAFLAFFQTETVFWLTALLLLYVSSRPQFLRPPLTPQYEATQ